MPLLTIVLSVYCKKINDTPHLFAKNFAAAVERDSGSRTKSEVYAARQLRSIPRQIEGTSLVRSRGRTFRRSFVGVDERFEAMAGPGLVDSTEHGQRVAADPAVLKLMLGHRPAVMHHLENSDSPPRRLQREEDSGLRLPVPDSRI
jgi:TRAP-type C4-dicarboxylate transport system substrate-binding protein